MVICLSQLGTVATIVPLPKGNKDPSSSDNYRPIALAPTLSKALEWCILLSYPDLFLTLGLQFGFKQKMSTTLCTGVVKNIVSCYMHENSAPYLPASLMPQRHLIL